jgi:hypothetical protein
MTDPTLTPADVRGALRPMLDGLYDVTLPASGRDGLTLREAAIEAILIREQGTAFSVVARHIAALFTLLDAIPPTCPTATCHGCPDPEACEALRPTPVPEASGRPSVHLLLDIWQALGGDSEAFHPWWAADPSFPDRWAQIVAAVAGNISGLAADTNPPAGALLDIAIQFGAADRGEPTDG